MRKRNLTIREEDQLRRFKQENQKLKKENSRLKKILARIDIETFTELEQVEEYQERVLKEKEEKKKQAEEYRLKWLCHTCQEDILKLYIYERPDGLYYYRRCSCGKKTRWQKYVETVEGPRG